MYVNLIFPGHRLNSSDLPALSIFASGWPHVDHGVVLELVSTVKYASAVICTNHGEFAILEEKESLPFILRNIVIAYYYYLFTIVALSKIANFN